MADAEKGTTNAKADPPLAYPGALTEDTLSDIDDVEVIAKGQIDPVYEAKARVLNRAARVSSPSLWSKWIANLGERCC